VRHGTLDVRFGSKADIPSKKRDVRFTPKVTVRNGSDHVRRSSSGSLAMVVRIQRASLRVSSLAARRARTNRQPLRFAEFSLAAA